MSACGPGATLLASDGPLGELGGLEFGSLSGCGRATAEPMRHPELTARVLAVRVLNLLK
jgi:hypothetical protein